MEPSGFEVKRYIQLVYRKRYIFIFTALAIMSTVVLISYLFPKEYETKCTVFIERSLINSLVKGIAVTPSMDDRLKILSYTMSSRSLLLKVVDDLGLNVNRNDYAKLEDLISDFRSNTDITMKNENDLFTVAYRNASPRLARDYVNTLVRRYVEENLSEKREETYGANRFLAEQIKYFKEKLDNADAEIIRFRKEKGVFVALDDRKVVEDVQSSEEALEELRIKKRELEARRNQIIRHMKEERPYTATILGKGAGSIDERLMALQKRLADLLMMYTANYPEVIRVRAELESLRAQSRGAQDPGAADIGSAQGTEAEMSMLNPLFQSLKEELSKTELELAALKAKDEQIRRIMELKKTYLKSMPLEKKNLSDLEMQRATNKNIYEELIARLSQSEVAKQMELQDKASTFRIVDPAVLPTKPVSPDRVKIILLGIIGGLAGGFGTVVLIDYMDRSVRNVDVLKDLGVPVLAVIPSIQDQADVAEQRRKDILLYKFAGACMVCILAVFTMELLGLTYIDDFVSSIIHLPGRLLGLGGGFRKIF